MKKTIAALGASVLGLGTVAVVGSPAAAAPPTEACTDMLDQVESTFTIESEDWFQDCVPQYGLGKVEFTIVPDESNPTEEFPEEFELLSDFPSEESTIETTSTLDLEELTSYLTTVVGESDVLVPPIAPMEPFDLSETSQSYIALAVSPVSSVGPATVENTPEDVIEACEVGESSIGWVATFDPIDTTFSQTIDGEAWDYTITGASKPTYFFITEDDVIEPVCVTDGEYSISGDFDYTEALFLFALVMPFVADDVFMIPASLEQALGEFASVSGVDGLDDLNFAALGESGLQTLGVFSRDGITPTPPGPAQLPATGADASSLVVPAVVVGGVVLLGGALVTISIIRRRRNDPAA